MNEEAVYKAERKMRKVTHIVKTISVIAVLSHFAFGLYLAFSPIDIHVKLPLLLLLGYIPLILISLLGMYSQKTIFDTAMSLLKYVEENYPDVELPSLPKEVYKGD